MSVRARARFMRPSSFLRATFLLLVTVLAEEGYGENAGKTDKQWRQSVREGGKSREKREAQSEVWRLQGRR